MCLWYKHFSPTYSYKYSNRFYPNRFYCSFEQYSSLFSCVFLPFKPFLCISLILLTPYSFNLIKYFIHHTDHTIHLKLKLCRFLMLKMKLGMTTSLAGTVVATPVGQGEIMHVSP